MAVRASVGKRDGSDLGDGILFQLAVVDAAGKQTMLAQQMVKEHEWLPIEGDLSPWAGQSVRLKLIADVGPNDDSSGDWSCWADVRVESLDTLPVRTLRERTAADALEPPPIPLPGLRAADLRGAKSGVLHYEAIGLAGPGEYESMAVLNGHDLGLNPDCMGDERAGKWGTTEIAVPADKLADLRAASEFRIRNDNHKYYKIRRAWLEVTLADGRRVSSHIAAGCFTQPAGWEFEEGETVPFGEDVTFPLWFDAAP
jgi:hypothetical protein